MNLIKKIFVGAACMMATAACFMAGSKSFAATSTSWNFKNTNFKNLGTIKSTVTVDNLTLTANSSKTMQVKSNSVSVSGTSYTHCLALGGGGTTTYRSVKVPVSGASTIKVTLDASFRNDLGADSLDTYELVYAIEEELGVSIPDEKANEFETVRDAYDFIKAELDK